jgi:hypothetical protein
MNKLYSFVLLSTLLTACGGGGSESSTPAPSANNSQPVNSVPAPIVSQATITEFSLVDSIPAQSVELIESAAQNSSEISVPDGFALNSERSLTLRITLSEEDNQPAYLSLCSDYQQLSDGSYSIYYASCLLRTSLNDSQYEAVITVTNDTQGLVAALWFMDETKQPLFTDWRFNNN